MAASAYSTRKRRGSSRVVHIEFYNGSSFMVSLEGCTSGVRSLSNKQASSLLNNLASIFSRAERVLSLLQNSRLI